MICCFCNRTHISTYKENDDRSREKEKYLFCFQIFISLFRKSGPLHTPWGPPPARAGGVGVAVAKRLFEERICQVHVSQMPMRARPRIVRLAKGSDAMRQAASGGCATARSSPSQRRSRPSRRTAAAPCWW